MAEENQQNSDVALAPPQEITKPYGWGKFQGVALILISLGALRHGWERLIVQQGPRADVDIPAFPAILAASALQIALAICVLRRNRLILPLMGVSIILSSLNVIGAFLRRDELGLGFATGLAIPFVIWALSGVYYYNRRSEFNRWL